MEYAIFRASGEQFRASVGDVLQVPLMDAKPGSKISFSEVLLTGDGNKISAGQPTVKGAKVSAQVVRHGKGVKLIIFKFKRRKNYRRKTGHRQQFTEIRITALKT